MISFLKSIAKHQRMKKYLPIYGVLAIILAILVTVFLLHRTTGKSVVGTSQYSDQGVSFKYPASYRLVEDIISEKTTGVYVKSVQFSTEKEKADMLPMQITVIKNISNNDKFEAKIAEVEKYYKENGKEIATDTILGQSVAIYQAEKKNDKKYILGFYIRQDEYLILVERFRYGTEKDNLADEFVEKLKKSLNLRSE